MVGDIFDRYSLNIKTLIYHFFNIDGGM